MHHLSRYTAHRHELTRLVLLLAAIKALLAPAVQQGPRVLRFDGLAVPAEDKVPQERIPRGLPPPLDMDHVGDD